MTREQLMAKRDALHLAAKYASAEAYETEAELQRLDGCPAREEFYRAVAANYRGDPGAEERSAKASAALDAFYEARDAMESGPSTPGRPA